MKGQLLTLPTQPAVDAAWNRYHALVREAIDNPELQTDRNHAQACIRAHKAFADAYLGSLK
ncbi:MAG TPA: hypothetical protein VFS91_05170 [Nitrobacter sp.]|nr:hypothetical protein [Nitrobacter sp.]